MKQLRDQDDLHGVRAMIADVAEWSKVAGEGVSLATFAGFDEQGRFLVVLSGSLPAVPALSTLGLSRAEAGVAVVVAFQKGRVRSPVILGRLQAGEAPSPTAAVEIDGERVVLQARQRIDLRCGDASIVLTKAGKVLIKGNFVLTRSRGANKIKGAHVDIN
ncbi:hypothetical protein GCM10023165_45600 [Variovorax defluvii]|uniref:DUF6484 domain-containing protein n=1 Tax=Variovorax defluvii TaxID=913761 RepID=A0ABP8I9S8_9BURK